jgi:putative NIF3 family GTP cyclohydrolase 1 type 2
LSPLIPDSKHEGFGMGVIGRFPKPISDIDLAKKCRDIFGSPIRYCKGRKDMIESIAIVCGSGSSYYQDAIISKVDCFITADVKYHQFHEARGNIMLIDPGHAEMEQFVVAGMTSLLRNDEHLQSIAFIESQVNTSPIHYAL